jgi:hypothetical protein
MTSKPPIFPSQTHGLPLPLQYLARARLFRGLASPVAISTIRFAHSFKSRGRLGVLLIDGSSKCH